MKKIKICLDAGHYGKYNQSPAVKTYYESDMNWKLHNLLKEHLEQYGIEVTQTRSNQKTDLGLFSRGQKAKGCDLFLSIHSNAVGSGVNETVDYPVVYVPLNGSGDDIGKKLAECIEKTMGTKQEGRTATRKGNNGDYYGVIRGAVSVGVPGLILEHSFHTNTKMTKWLLVEANLKKLAEVEAKTIAEWFDVKKTEETTTNREEGCEVTLPMLQKGSKGDSVRALQILLIGYGYSCGKWGADGDFGGDTEAAVKAYQKKNKLDVDGIVGSATWGALLK